MTTRILLAAAIASALCAALPVAALAQETQPQQMEPAGYTDEKLELFATAWLRVNTIGLQYEPQLAAASEQERPLLQERIEGLMTNAVEELEGITVEEYNAIDAAAEADPAMSEKIQAIINRLREEQAAAAAAQ